MTKFLHFFKIGLFYFLRPSKPYKNYFLSIIQFLMLFPQFANASYEIPIDLTQVFFSKKVFFRMLIVSLLINMLSSTSMLHCFRATKLQSPVWFPLKKYCKTFKMDNRDIMLTPIIYRVYLCKQKFMLSKQKQSANCALTLTKH